MGNKRLIPKEAAISSLAELTSNVAGIGRFAAADDPIL